MVGILGSLPLLSVEAWSLCWWANPALASMPSNARTAWISVAGVPSGYVVSARLHGIGAAGARYPLHLFGTQDSRWLFTSRVPDGNYRLVLNLTRSIPRPIPAVSSNPQAKPKSRAREDTVQYCLHQKLSFDGNRGRSTTVRVSVANAVVIQAQRREFIFEDDDSEFALVVSGDGTAAAPGGGVKIQGGTGAPGIAVAGPPVKATTGETIYFLRGLGAAQLGAMVQHGSGNKIQSMDPQDTQPPLIFGAVYRGRSKRAVVVALDPNFSDPESEQSVEAGAHAGIEIDRSKGSRRAMAPAGGSPGGTGNFLSAIKTRQNQLRIFEEASPPSVPKRRRGTVKRNSGKSTATPAMSAMVSDDGRAWWQGIGMDEAHALVRAVASPPWSMASIDVGKVCSTQPLVDPSKHAQFVLCGDELVAGLADNVCEAPQAEHSTAVFGIMSASTGPQSSVPKCAPGMNGEWPHITVAWPALNDNAATADAQARRMADLLLWLSGLTVPARPNWQNVSSLGLSPARVIDLTDDYDQLFGLAREEATWSYLAAAIDRVTTEGCNGLGTVIALSAGNMAVSKTDDDMNIPIRPGVLVVTGNYSSPRPQTGSRRGGMALGPVCSLTAPSAGMSLAKAINDSTCWKEGTHDACKRQSNMPPFTSYTAPMVGGAVAHVAKANGTLTARQIADLLKDTARVIDGSTGRTGNVDDQIGRWVKLSLDGNIIDEQPAVAPADGSASRPEDAQFRWFSPWFGHGELNVAEAVRRAGQP